MQAPTGNETTQGRVANGGSYQGGANQTTQGAQGTEGGGKAGNSPVGSQSQDKQPVTLLQMSGGRKVAILGQCEKLSNVESDANALDIYRNDGWEIYGEEKRGTQTSAQQGTTVS